MVRSSIALLLAAFASAACPKAEAPAPAPPPTPSHAASPARAPDAPPKRPSEPAPEAAKPAPKAAVIAVFDIEDASESFDPKVVRQLGDYLSARVAALVHTRVAPRDQLRALLSEAKAASYRACFDQACQIELGKAIAAEKSLSTKLLRVGASCALTATLFDLASETTERAASAKTACSPDAMFAAIDEVVRQLDGGKTPGLEAPKSPVKQPAKVESPPMLTLHETPPAEPRAGVEPPLVLRWSKRRGHIILDLPDPITFARDHDDLDAQTKQQLTRLARAILEQSAQSLEIAGHADERERGKLELSERRARKVRTYLVDRGVPISRLTLVAAGDSEPLIRAGSDAQRAPNRRVELRRATRE